MAKEISRQFVSLDKSLINAKHAQIIFIH